MTAKLVWSASELRKSYRYHNSKWHEYLDLMNQTSKFRPFKRNEFYKQYIHHLTIAAELGDCVEWKESET